MQRGSLTRLTPVAAPYHADWHYLALERLPGELLGGVGEDCRVQ
jgi:hypothetical protein